MLEGEQAVSQADMKWSVLRHVACSFQASAPVWLPLVMRMREIHTDRRQHRQLLSARHRLNRSAGCSNVRFAYSYFAVVVQPVSQSHVDFLLMCVIHWLMCRRRRPKSKSHNKAAEPTQRPTEQHPILLYKYLAIYKHKHMCDCLFVVIAVVVAVVCGYRSHI